MPPRKRPLTERIESRIVRDPASDCWIWQGKTDKAGYGSMGVDGRTMLVHRVAYMTYIGPIPPGMQVDHVRERGCVWRNCCNPAHLEAVSPLVNMNRTPITFTPGGRCQKGLHDITVPGAVKVTSAGKRFCVECQRAYDREKQRRYRANKKKI